MREKEEDEIRFTDGRLADSKLVEDFEEFLLLGGNGVKYISLPLPAAHRECNKFRRVAEGVIYS